MTRLIFHTLRLSGATLDRGITFTQVPSPVIGLGNGKGVAGLSVSPKTQTPISSFTLTVASTAFRFLLLRPEHVVSSCLLSIKILSTI